MKRSCARGIGLLTLAIPFWGMACSGLSGATDRPALSGEMSLSQWELGIGLHASADPQAFIYLRFYEWNLFDAVKAGEHTAGVDRWPWEISADGKQAVLNADFFRMKVQAVSDGADIELTVTNLSGHDWPEVAAIIPCLSPEYSRAGIPENPSFFDDQYTRTYFLGPAGLEALDNRDMHFREALKDQALRRSRDGAGMFEGFSNKWPTSSRDAAAGLMLRESADQTWVTGIAWDDFLTAQGHNPRKCMHLSARVGPLKIGESKTLRGKIYLFRGTREDCLNRFRKDFPKKDGGM